MSGPTEIQSHWSKNLKPGDSFTTVPVAVGVGHDDFEEAIGTLTKYRRRIRRPNKDNENLPVIFNDYMNCLFGDPTTEKEFPLVDAAEKQDVNTLSSMPAGMRTATGGTVSASGRRAENVSRTAFVK